MRFGAGHLARSRSLAAALDPSAILYCDPDGSSGLGWNSQVVREIAVDSAAAAIIGLRDGSIKALIVDSYAIDDAAIRQAVKAGFAAVLRDGMPYGPESVSINPNPGYTETQTVLAGVDYMPLSVAFAQRNKMAREMNKTLGEPLSILVAFGVRDSANRTMTALAGLREYSERLEVSVALGPHAVHYAAVASKIDAMKCAEILPEQEEMHTIYGRFDLAIGAPGVSQFERVCCGLPTVLISQNERQEPLARAWSITGAAVYCDPTPASVSKAVAGLLENPPTINGMRERGLSLVDGKGATRLADALKRIVS
jgi:spore coat polysaccharide biosynthesis predicted glycosyltransferase SpsG